MHIYSKNGHTLVELLIVAGMMTVILAASTAMWVGSVRCYSNITARTGSDMDAVAAMQMIVTDVREAKEAIPISSGKRLRVTLPRHWKAETSTIDFCLILPTK